MKKQNIKSALKQITKISNQMSEGMYMDNAMDGSGECGGMIFNSWSNWFNKKLNEVLDQFQVTIDELRTTADEWAKLELEKGPKQVFIAMYSKKCGLYKEVDYLDTKWGCIVMELDQMTN